MPKYNVVINPPEKSYIVDAEDEKQAKDMALEQYLNSIDAQVNKLED